MTKEKDNLTPAMKQFHHFKEKYPDAILFFRMGDFYETFYEDAQICARVLGLTLTSRSKAENPIPLAGVPYHAVDGYLKKMLQAGYKVAVCEQVEDPKQAKGVVRRDVVRVVTPGTLTDEMLLEEREDNFLACVSLSSASPSISWVDISTGHFFVQLIHENELLNELLKLSPREVLLPDMRGELFEAQVRKLADEIGAMTTAVITYRPGWFFDRHNARTRLLKQFQTQTLEGFGIPEDFPGIESAGAILEYLQETQKTALSHIASLRRVEKSNVLEIDANSLSSLEVLRTIRSESTKGSLLDCMDACLTGMGHRLTRAWICRPLRDRKTIERRQDAVAEFAREDGLRESIRTHLKQISDIERIAARISTFRTNPRDLVALAATLKQIPTLRQRLTDCTSELLGHLGQSCDSMDELADLIQSAIIDEPPTHTRDGGVIRTGYHEKLDKLRTISRDGRSYISQFQKTEMERTGIANLKIGYNKVFGYYIEVPRHAAEQVPATYTRKQTIKNAERYITPELKEFEDQVLGAQERALELENQLFEELRNETTKYIARLQSLAGTIAACDALCGFAHLARTRGYTRPEMCDESVLEIIGGKHPVLDVTLGNEFVPNDTCLGDSAGDLAIITGPNMAGKSTYIRQTALLTLLAHTGSFIPAESARVGITDKIFTRVGASDELIRNQSTFMVEMTETANILNNATDRSLVILDEVGRGTSTYDGLSLAWAITEHIANHIRCRTLFATHYHQLTELGELLENVKNLNVAVREWQDQVVFLHKILPGGTDKSYGIHVAKLAGVPNPIINRSREILTDLEETFAREAASEKLSRHQTAPSDELLFVQRNRSVLERIKDVNVNELTPIEAINLLNEIQKEMSD